MLAFICRSSFWSCVLLASINISLWVGPVRAATHPVGFTAVASLSIQMEKDIFEVGEPVEGKVILQNIYSATLPGVYIVRLYQNGDLILDVTSSIRKIPKGTMEFGFREFGITVPNADASSVGSWRLTIVQKDVDEKYAKEESFSIVPKR